MGQKQTPVSKDWVAPCTENRVPCCTGRLSAEDKGGVRDRAWIHSKKKDQHAYVFPVTAPVPPWRRMTNDLSGVPAFYGEGPAPPPACEHTWNRQRQEPGQLPAGFILSFLSFLSSRHPQ